MSKGKVTHRPESLFDDKGFRIPPQGIKGEIGDIDIEYDVFEPMLRYVDRCERLQNAGFCNALFQHEDFEVQTRRLIVKVKSESCVRKILKGVCLPLFIPRMVVEEYGVTLNRLVRVVKVAYDGEYPHRVVTKAYVIMGDLEGQLSVVPESRHDQLLERVSQGYVSALYFPQPLQGYSVHAQREQMSSLPEGFLLAGGIDMAIAWIMYPDVVARDERTPRYDSAALSVRPLSGRGDEQDSLYFWTCGFKAHVSRGRVISSAYPGYSGGLLYIG